MSIYTSVSTWMFHTITLCVSCTSISRKHLFGCLLQGSLTWAHVWVSYMNINVSKKKTPIKHLYNIERRNTFTVDCCEKNTTKIRTLKDIVLYTTGYLPTWIHFIFSLGGFKYHDNDCMSLRHCYAWHCYYNISILKKRVFRILVSQVTYPWQFWLRSVCYAMAGNMVFRSNISRPWQQTVLQIESAEVSFMRS